MMMIVLSTLLRFSFFTRTVLSSPNDHYLQRWSLNSIFPHLLSCDFLQSMSQFFCLNFIKTGQMRKKQHKTSRVHDISFFLVQVDTCMMHNSLSFSGKGFRVLRGETQIIHPFSLREKKMHEKMLQKASFLSVSDLRRRRDQITV